MRKNNTDKIVKYSYYFMVGSLLIYSIILFKLSKSSQNGDYGIFTRKNIKKRQNTSQNVNDQTEKLSISKEGLSETANTKSIFNKEFSSLFILILSLIHGSMFFILIEQFINLINNYSAIDLSIKMLFFIIFLRIFQTHILAAIKYKDVWTVRVFDFISIFVVAINEFLLFKYQMVTITKHEIYISKMIIIFCALGIVGYICSLLNVISKLSFNYRKIEIKIQITNIVILIIVATLYMFFLYIHINFIIINIVASLLILLNIYTSLKWSIKLN